MAPEAALRRALALAEQARGRTSPNPLVGCVIVRRGQVVGEGFHAAAGGPHAERVALAAAGQAARGATLYCTLEPCRHHGRTPPCTEAIIAAGVGRVVYGLDDPDPRVAGGGAADLRAAGLKVQGGLLAAEVAAQLEAYLHHRRSGRPLVIAKWAMTLDGKLATAGGDSRWVSGPEARARVHALRDRVDAVLVGSGTILADDPSLTCRLADFGPVERPPRNPLRVVLDTAGVTPASARVFTDGAAPTLLAVGADHGPRRRPGAEVLALPERDGHVDPAALLDELGRRGVVELLCESGGGLTGALLRANLVQRVLAVIAPKLVGGGGPTPWDGPGVQTMAEALTLLDPQTERLGPDILVSGRLGKT
jgi:diaminohydroxyphosphoribosylaminopyrimidine deaminase/5-amino-6-(5-phosphoribosylamino)uracil reductase